MTRWGPFQRRDPKAGRCCPAPKRRKDKKSGAEPGRRNPRLSPGCPRYWRTTTSILLAIPGSCSPRAPMPFSDRRSFLACLAGPGGGGSPRAPRSAHVQRGATAPPRPSLSSAAEAPPPRAAGLGLVGPANKSGRRRRRRSDGRRRRRRRGRRRGLAAAGAALRTSHLRGDTRSLPASQVRQGG